MEVKFEIVWLNYRKKGSGVVVEQEGDFDTYIHKNWFDSNGYLKRICIDSIIKPMLELQASLLGYDTFKIKKFEILDGD